MPTLELTDNEIKHVQLLLQQEKPSRTRLTREEKNILKNLLNSIISELSCVSVTYEHREPTGWEEAAYIDAQEHIKHYDSIIKKLK